MRDARTAACAACAAVAKHGASRVSPGVLALCEGRAIPATPVAPAPPPLPRSAWPLLARAVAKLAKPEDKGIGDVVARMAGAVGGETMSEWYTRLTGKECGCASRQNALNAMYPFPAS